MNTQIQPSVHRNATHIELEHESLADARFNDLANPASFVFSSQSAPAPAPPRAVRFTLLPTVTAVGR